VPSNHNFVCFDCRVNVRRSKRAEVAPLCPQCGGECTSIGYKIPIPPKDDLSAWQRLYADLREAKRRLIVTEQERRVALTHELQRQLERLELRALNPERERTIRALKRSLDELKQQSR
jgi:hypothetical protein